MIHNFTHLYLTITGCCCMVNKYLTTINNCMNKQYLLPMARNTVTGQTIKTQDLTGTRFALNQRRLAQDVADQTAAKMSVRTGVTWQGFLVEYQPTERAG